MGELVIINREVVCRCGRTKHPNSLMCAECRAEYRKMVAEDKLTQVKKEERTCPVCGGTKTPKAEICRACSIEKNRRKVPHPKTICPDCGGEKAKEAKQCRDCRERERGWGDYSEKHLYRPEYGEPRLSRGRAIEALHFRDERAGITTEAVACSVGG